jgi:hypothetical protein
MFGLYNKLINLIFSYLFPVPKPTKEDKLLRVMGEYLKLVSDVPFDNFRISFYGDSCVGIYLIYDSWERAYEYIKQEDTLEREMGKMFPYKFSVSYLVS